MVPSGLQPRFSTAPASSGTLTSRSAALNRFSTTSQATPRASSRTNASTPPVGPSRGNCSGAWVKVSWKTAPPDADAAYRSPSPPVPSPTITTKASSPTAI